MNQRVPSWDLRDNTPPNLAKFTFHGSSNAHNCTAPSSSMLDYEVAELTWENGQLAMHGFGPPRNIGKPYTLEKPRAGGTLESIVDQATRLPNSKASLSGSCDDELVPWLDQGSAATTTTAAAAASPHHIIMDAMVPCSTSGDYQPTHLPNPNSGNSTTMARWSKRVESCSGEMLGKDTSHVTLDKCEEKHLNVDLDSTEKKCSGKRSTSCTVPLTVDDNNDCVCHGTSQEDEAGNEPTNQKGQTMKKSSVSTKKKRRVAAVHNQYERKRRDRINQRIRTLQKLVPNSSKTDKASILEEVIDYLKQLQAQVQMMSKMNIPYMMFLMAMQQQLQMSIMPQMGMGIGSMDMNSIGRSAIAGIPPIINPVVFMPLASGNGSKDCLSPSGAVMHDPLSTFLASQTQPMTMDAYSKMVAFYQQLHQPTASHHKDMGSQN